MQEIVIINQDSGYLMIDLANAYNEKGYKVTLVAGRLVQRDIALSENIRLKKIIRYNRSSTIKRLFTWGWGTIQILFLVWFKFRQNQLFIVSNPPFATLLPMFFKNRYSLLIYDIYPDALTEIGTFTDNSFVVKYWQKANIKIFSKAERIVTLTSGMKNVLGKYAGAKPIEVIPIWTDNQFLKPLDQKKNPFIQTHHLNEKFIVLYSGNIGMSGDVDIILDLAENLKSFENIVFVIIGDGAKRDQIVKKTDDLKLHNVKMLPWQPVTELPYSLASANLAVVTLGRSASKLAMPSKLFNFLSVGAPLLCITSHDSEVAALVQNYNCGKSFEPGEIQEMTEYIVTLANKKEICTIYQQNALEASLDFTKKNVYQFIS